jgi:hypothetical protein
MEIGMETANHAIKVAPNAQGWTWELIDTDGVTSAMGSHLVCRAGSDAGQMGSCAACPSDWRAIKK